jgi:hypothetical protein
LELCISFEIEYLHIFELNTIMGSRCKIIGFFLFIVNLEVNYSQSPSLGAIRWDAWTGSANSIGIQVEQSLSPSKFHYRVPFFGIEVDMGTVKIDGTTQAIMDQEIDFAKYAGLDYWAFVWYPSASGLDAARKLYYSSSKKDLIDYSLIIDPAFFIKNISIEQIIHEFQDPSYFKVMNGRPLLYFLGYSGILVSDIDTLKTKCASAGIGNPYIVELRVDGNFNVVDSLHMDAFGMYATSWIKNGVPYQDLANADISQWDYIGKTIGKKVVPHVTTGWDTRPINENPLSWYTIGPDAWVQMPSAAEIANHVNDAVSWVNSNPSIAEANTVLIYAWNEHVEGGWLCPTLSNYGYTDRIDSLNVRFGKPATVYQERSMEEQFFAYPNPAKDKLRLYNGDKVFWSLKNIQGIEILKGHGIDCDLSSLSRGIYIISANNKSIRIIKV